MKKTLLSFLILISLPVFVFAADPVVNTTLRVTATGSEPFDTTTWDGTNLATAGLDQDPNNNVVRLQDIVFYRVEVSVNDSDVDNLISTFTVDKKQAIIELPQGCLTDPLLVNPVSSISTDLRTLTCNLGPALEGTTRLFSPTTRVIGIAADGEVTRNNDLISANASSEADGIPNVKDPEPTETIVTTAFKVDTVKELKVDATDPVSGESLYVAPPKMGDLPGQEDGSLMEYVIRIEYNPGSTFINSADELGGNFEVDIDLVDFYTDDNNFNNIGGLSTGGILYDWDPAIPACELVGDHGPNATVNCSQGAIILDPISPGGLSSDGLNDPNILIDLDNIDVRDPNSDGNFLELRVNIWFSRANDIDNHQSCGGVCTNFVSNHIGTFDGAFQGFNPLSTEDGMGTNLSNFNTLGEPRANNSVSYPLVYSDSGSVSIRKSFEGFSNGQKNGQQFTAIGEVIPLMLNSSDTRLVDQLATQICDKIDTSVFEYVGLSSAPRNDLRSFRNHSQYNPAILTRGPGAGDVFADGTNFVDILYSDEPNTTLAEQRDDVCNDDVNGDLKVVIDGINQVTLLADSPNDWVSDPTTLTGGLSSVSKIRQEARYDGATTLEMDPTHTVFFAMVNHELRVKSDASAYGPNDYLPNYATFRTMNNSFIYDDTRWQDASGVSIDPAASGFSFNLQLADRMILVMSDHSISKDTIPSGIQTVAAGQIVDFLIKPELFGAWDVSITEASIDDALPVGTAYVPNSEMFSIDGGLTWLTHNQYIASSPVVTLASPKNAGPNLLWNFGDLQTGEQLPLIRYQVQVDPTATVGSFVNTATITSQIGEELTASDIHQLNILPEFGLDVSKANVEDVYSTNTAFPFELTYRNLGGEDYAQGEFIDVLPFNDDGAAGATAGGLASPREPSSTFDGIYELTSLSGTNGETFYATIADPTTIPIDPCHEDNQASMSTPGVGDLCENFYNSNGGKFAGGATEGTGAIDWQQCTTLTSPIDCGGLDPALITAIRFTTDPILSTSGAHTVVLELSPVGNIGGTPDIDVRGNVTSASTGNIYTNTFGGRVGEITLDIISNDVSVTMVSGSIGDFVWFDLSNDGVQDPGEPGLAGVEIKLLDGAGNPIFINPATGAVVPSDFPGAMLYTTTTDANGEYSFDNLPQGTYQVMLDPATIPPGLVNTFDPDVGGPGDNMSTYTLNEQRDAFGTLESIEDNVDQDFGYYAPPAEIGNFAWIDSNRDGVQDPGEEALAGVKIELFDSAGNLVGTAITDANGKYLFENLVPGDYNLKFTPPSGLTFTNQDQGSDDADDSDVNPVTGMTITTTLDAGESDLTWDAGFILVPEAPEIPGPGGGVLIGDTIFFDSDRDGQQGPNDLPMAGVTVNLYDSTGNVVGTTITDENGNFLFDVASGSDYEIRLDNPTDFQSDGPLNGAALIPAGIGDETIDSNGELVNGFPAFKLTSPDSGEDLTFDFGFEGSNGRNHAAILDSLLSASASIVSKLATSLVKNCSFSRRKANKFSTKANSLYLEGWTEIWTRMKIENEVLCSDSQVLTPYDNRIHKKFIRRNFKRIKKLATKAAKHSCDNNIFRIEGTKKKLSVIAKRMRRRLKRVPNIVDVCIDPSNI